MTGRRLTRGAADLSTECGFTLWGLFLEPCRLRSGTIFGFHHLKTRTCVMFMFHHPRWQLLAMLRQTSRWRRKKERLPQSDTWRSESLNPCGTKSTGRILRDLVMIVIFVMIVRAGAKKELGRI